MAIIRFVGKQEVVQWSVQNVIIKVSTVVWQDLPGIIILMWNMPVLSIFSQA